MIIQVHLTDSEAIDWLQAQGYTCELRTITEFRSAYHNRLEEHGINRLHVNVNGKWEPARPFAEALLKHNIVSITQQKQKQ